MDAVLGLGLCKSDEIVVGKVPARRKGRELDVSGSCTVVVYDDAGRADGSDSGEVEPTAGFVANGDDLVNFERFACCLVILGVSGLFTTGSNPR